MKTNFLMDSFGRLLGVVKGKGKMLSEEGEVAMQQAMQQGIVAMQQEVSDFEEFDDTTSYAEGDVVRKEGKLYKFTAAHEGEWSDDDVEQTNVFTILEDMIQDSSKAYIIDANKTLSVVAGTTKTISGVPFLTMTQIDNLYANFIAGKNCLIKWEPNGYDKVVSVGWINGNNHVTIVHTDRNEDTTYNITYHYDGSWISPRKVYLDGNGVVYKNDTDEYLINHIAYSEEI